MTVIKLHSFLKPKGGKEEEKKGKATASVCKLPQHHAALKDTNASKHATTNDSHTHAANQ